METKTILSLYPAQQAFHDATENWRGFEAGLAAGKTFVGAWDTLSRLRDGDVALAVAHSVAHIKFATFPVMCEMAERMGIYLNSRNLIPLLTVRTPEDGEAKIVFASSGSIDGCASLKKGHIWLDEPNLMDQAVMDSHTIKRAPSISMTFSHGWPIECFYDYDYDTFKWIPKPDRFIVHANSKDNPHFAYDSD